ncbi:MAG: hydantoinase/oxoprolinase family protein [Eubacteriales bacterium]|nr:hydantoinase/oxoprolinase family protein [Eubacteriales bacterium]
MDLAIGIDTGGTYTDGVLVDVSTGNIINTTKTPTTHDDLSICVRRIFEELSVFDNRVCLVSISTTLATNACAEGRGARCKLILFGSSPKDVDELGPDVGLIPSNQIYFAKGAVNMRGDVIEAFDEKGFTEDFLSFCDNYDAFGVVQVWGMKNPVLEKKAKEIIKTLSDKPVVCGYELSSNLNYLRRAVSAYLNGTLTPIFNDFMDSVKLDMNNLGIECPIFVVRGDGSVMSEEYARTRPVETLLSGPAASVLGARALCPEVNDAVVIDMGGTTSDIAVIKDRSILISEEGASVSGFLTSTRAIDITTEVLGCDVEVLFDNQSVPYIGRRRIVPLCVLSMTHPEVKEFFKGNGDLALSGTAEDASFYYVAASEKLDYKRFSDEEMALIASLKGEALNMSEIRRRFGNVYYRVIKLYDDGVLSKAGLTATDYLHIKDDFDAFDAEASYLAANYCASLSNRTAEEDANTVYNLITRGLFGLYFAKLAMMEEKLSDMNDRESLTRISDFAYYGSDGFIGLKAQSDFAVIGIGASAHIFIPRLREHVNGECIVPKNAGVGNALGAILGSVEADGTVEVRRREEAYDIIGPVGLIGRDPDYSSALARAKKEAEAIALESFSQKGGFDAKLETRIEDRSTGLLSLVHSAVVRVKATQGIIDMTREIFRK